MGAKLRLALIAVAAGTLAGCATAEDYLTSINPFRRQDRAAPASPAAAPPAVRPTGGEGATPLPAPRPSEPAR